MHQAHGHAVVLGAGFAGLLAAGVLAEQFAAVTVVERDRLPDSPIQRRGIPQGRHLHSLLSRGSHALEELHPGILDTLTAAGAHKIDGANLSKVYTRMGPYTMNRTGSLADPDALAIYLASRPFLEFHLRQRIADHPNVTFRDGLDVIGFDTPSADHVAGAQVADRNTGTRSSIAANLVVDALGRSTRTPELLERLGYGPPDERVMPGRGAYYSQLVTMPSGSIRERLVLVQPDRGARRGGLIAYEHDTWMLTVTGPADDFSDPPADFADMLALAERFAPRQIMAALRAAKPLGPVQPFRYPGGSWQRYDRMDRFPSGLLVIGDALCRLDPIFGQGMTVAALQALALRDHLAEYGTAAPQLFFGATAHHIGPVWSMNRATAGAGTPQRGLAGRLMSWIRGQVLQAAANDIVITERLMRVSSLIDPPDILRDPVLLGRALMGNLMRRNPFDVSLRAQRLSGAR